MAHTILLIQPGGRPETRTYSDYESVNECMEGVCKIYEEHLKRRNPNTPTITYDISQLFDFVDQVNMKTSLILLKRTSSSLFSVPLFRIIANPINIRYGKCLSVIVSIKIILQFAILM